MESNNNKFTIGFLYYINVEKKIQMETHMEGDRLSVQGPEYLNEPWGCQGATDKLSSVSQGPVLLL